MKKRPILLIWLAVFCLTVVCCANGAFCFADTQEDLSRLQQISDELASMESLYSLAGLSLINEANYLLRDTEVAELCSAELRSKIAEYELNYHKLAETKKVEACFIQTENVLMFPYGSRHYQPEQWQRIIELKSEFTAALAAADTITETSGLADGFLEAAADVRTLEQDSTEQNDFIEEWVAKLDTELIKVINSLASPFYSGNITDAYPYRCNEPSDDYDLWFEELISKTFRFDDLDEITALHTQAIANICAEANGSSNCERIVNEFSEALKQYPKLTTDVNNYLLSAAKEAAATRLGELYKNEKYEQANTKAKQTIQKIIEDGLARLNNATTNAEVSLILHETETSVAETDISSKNWIWLCVAASIIFVGFIVALIIYAEHRRKAEGKAKLAELLEDERERVDKETETAVTDRQAEGKDDTVEKTTPDTFDAQDNAQQSIPIIGDDSPII